MFTSSHLLRRALPTFAAYLLLFPAAGWAYVVILKDGTQITTEGKYEVKGNQVLLTLPNGTQTSYPSADVDFGKTDEVNRGVNLSGARLIEGGQSVQLSEETRFEDDRKTFGELLNERSSGLALPEPRVRQATQETAGAAGPPVTTAGFVDLVGLRREPFENSEILSEVIGYLKGQGNDDVRVFQGSEPGHPLVEIVAASEASVFKSMKDAANCLVQIHERYPSDVTAFDLLLVTDNNIRAGQFSLTPEMANLLVTGQMEAPAFFLRYVEF
ncbi:MAG: hypothetical protein AAGN66_08235 [Acidobacteriota bacterium]